MDELRQRIVEEWERLDQRVIDNAVKQWNRRLRSCVAAKGGHICSIVVLTMQISTNGLQKKKVTSSLLFFSSKYIYGVNH